MCLEEFYETFFEEIATQCVCVCATIKNPFLEWKNANT